MYAIIQVGSEQFKVSEGDVIEVNRLGTEPGKNYAVDKVLLFAEGNKVQVGQPFLKDIKVSAKVEDHTRGEKVIAYKYRRRKSSASKKGHRQDLTKMTITKIAAK